MKRCILAFGIVWLLAGALAAHGATDSRFFGTYCGDDTVEQCYRYRTCFWFICSSWKRRCDRYQLSDLRVAVDYREPAASLGVVSGRGTGRVQGQGTPLRMSFSGVVASQGWVQGSVASNYFNPNTGTAVLSADGMVLTIHARGQSIELRKDRCGNQPPQVAITSPTSTALQYGRTEVVSGEVTADEDASFPRQRMSLVSDRDGPLSGYEVASDRRLSVFTNTLSPGPHRITFTAIDSGGLAGSAAIQVTVANQPPDVPEIIQPQTGDSLVATGSILFEGKAFDLEDGRLTGNALTWTAVPLGGAPQVLGHGNELTAALAAAGEYQLFLTASDSLGATRQTGRWIVVQPFTGNTPPRVKIVEPSHRDWKGMALVAGDEIELIGVVQDDQDPPGSLGLEWTAQATGAPPATPFATGTTTTTTTLYTLGGAYATPYTVTFSATDSGGLTAVARLEFVLLAQGIE